jgi:hypothetical protein
LQFVAAKNKNNWQVYLLNETIDKLNNNMEDGQKSKVPNQKEFDLSLQQVQVWKNGRSLHEAITQVGF